MLGTTTTTVMFADPPADRRGLGHVVSRHGGRIVQLGDDCVMAVFGSASDGVHAAVALQLQAPHPLRIGLAAGDVDWDGDECFGQPVLAAAALHATADDGQIRVSQIVRLLAGDRAGDRYELLGAYDIPDPVTVYAVGWAGAAVAGPTDSVPPPSMPSALAVPSAHPLVGRDAVLATIRDTWRGAQTGPGRVVLVGGEAGAGKTRLAAEIAAELRDRGACVLHGGCDSDLAMPYQPWVQALDQLLPALPRDLIAGAFGRSLAPIASLLARADRIPTDIRRITPDAGADRYRTYGAFRAAFTTGVGHWPTLLVLDDLHWAGAQTLALLRHLARTGLPAGMLVVGTFRDTGNEITEPLASCLADLRRVTAVTRLRLAALAPAAIEEYVTDAVDRPLDDVLRALAHHLAERSGGNAFYLGELWRHLVDTEAVRFDGTRWTVRFGAAGGVPDSVREVVNDRIARLSTPARAAIDLAALSAQRIDIEVLELACSRPIAELYGAVDELVGAGLLVDVAGASLGYRFLHSLVRDAVAETIPAHAFPRLHRALATAIESVHGTDRRPVLAEIAGHYAAAGGPPDKVGYYGQRAAAQAIRAAAYEEAVAHLDKVLALVLSPGDRAAALNLLGTAELRRGAFAASRRACAEAFALALQARQPLRVADAAVGYETALHFPGMGSDRAVEMLRTALDLVAAEPDACRAHVGACLGRALYLNGQTTEGTKVAADAVALARVSGDDATLSACLRAQVVSLLEPVHRRRAAIELRELEGRLDDPWAASAANAMLLTADLELGYNDEATEVLHRLRIVSEAGHFAVFEFMVHAFEAVLALAAGRLTDAEAAAERARAKGEADESPYDAGVYGLQMYAIRRAQGRLAEVAPIMRVVASSADPPPMWRPGLAALYADLGMVDEARAVFEQLARDDFADIARDSVWPASLTFLAEACLALRDVRRARVLYDELLGFAGRNLLAGMTLCLGPADRLLGGLASVLGLDDAVVDGHFTDAVALARSSKSPLWTVEARYDWANALSRRDSARAADLAAAAIATAEQLGIGRIASRTIPKPDGLSPRELEVLALVAAGRSNRQIGAALFISQNTVANHIRAILRKTSTGNRTEATLYAVRSKIVSAG